MSSNSQNDDFLTIRLDEEDRRDYQQKKQTTGKPAASTAQHPKAAPPSKGGSSALATFSLLIALGSSGAAYYLYDLSQKQATIAAEAEARILQLERKLSATDEEMGESTVALQVKVNELGEKTTELWDQMDKLWASAWRRNQQEIADLAAKLTSVQSGLQSSVEQVKQSSAAQQTKLSNIESQLNGQLASIADEMLALNFQLEQLAANRDSELQTNKNLQEQLAVIEQRNAALSGRIAQLESEIKAMATKLLTPNAAGGPATP